MSLLSTHDLGVTFRTRIGPVDALRGVDFAVEPGQRIGVVGGSGSGKTTLSRCLVGLQSPTAGQITFDGLAMGGAGRVQWASLRRRVAMVFQDPNSSLNPRMKLLDIVTEPLRAHGVTARGPRMEAAADALASVSLSAELLARYPHELSGGQRQRVAIARALVTQPEVLIADEPVSALDVSVRAQVIKLLRDNVEQRGLALIFVSHDLSLVRHLCDDVVVMQTGQIVEAGPATEVLSRPSHEYTRKLMDATLPL